MNLLRIGVAALACGAILGCGPKDNTTTTTAESTTGAPTGKKITVGIVFDKGGRGDRSFNDSAARGLDKAKADLGIEILERASPEEKDYETNLASLAQKDVDLVIGVGINMQSAVEKAAKEYPDIKFAIVDGDIDLPNVRSLKFKEEEGSFLAGYLGGLMSKSGKLGFVGGMEIPLIKKFWAGYVAGAKTANPAAEVLPAKYTGNWNDAGIAKLQAQALYGGGADIVYHAAGRAGLGVFEAARDADKFAIGVDSDQDDQAEGKVLTSMIKRVDEAVFSTIKDVQGGSFSAGSRIYDLKENGVGLSEMKFTKDLIGAGNLKKIEDIKAKIIAGEIVVPTDQETLDKYLATLKG